jgi:ABC-type nickel/cobalt efflux system permease component RcnA
MLLLIGAIVLFLRVPIPQPVAEVAECVVGFMLVALGGLLGMKLLRERWHLHQHDHDGTRHVHLHSHAQSRDHGHAHWWRESVRPLCIGMAHGLAGSAALLLFVVASAGSVLEGLLYIAVFGCGLLLSIPVVWSFRLGRPVFLALQGLASAGSIALGLAIVYRALTGAPLS